MPVPHLCSRSIPRARAPTVVGKKRGKVVKNYLHQNHGYYMVESFPVDVKLTNLPAILARGILTVSVSVRDVSESAGMLCIYLMVSQSYIR